MKKLFLMGCIIASTSTYAQTFKLRFIDNPIVYSDTINKTRVKVDTKFEVSAEVINKGSSYMLSSIDNKFVYIPYDQFKSDKKYSTWAVNNGKIYSADVIYLKTDEANKNGYYQETVKLSPDIKKSDIYQRVKQWAASTLASVSLQLSYDNSEEGKIVFSMVQNLFITQGFGSQPFEVKYTYTIDMKDGKYRYTVDNIEFGYRTLMLNNGKRETIYNQWIDCYKGTFYNNDLKRILSFQKHIKLQTDNLLRVVSTGNSLTQTDF